MHLIDIVPNIRAAALELREKRDLWNNPVNPELADKLDVIAEKVTVMIDHLYPLQEPDPAAKPLALKGLQEGSAGQVYSLKHGWVTPPRHIPENEYSRCKIGEVEWEWDKFSKEWRLV